MPLRAAASAFALFVAPAVFPAQPLPPQAQRPPSAHPVPSLKRPHQVPGGGFRYRPHHHEHHPISYPVVIDGSVLDRYLKPPAPAPRHRPTPPPRNGQDVFETHSTDDAK